MTLKLYLRLLEQSFSSMIAHRLTAILTVILGISFVLVEFIAGYVYFSFSDYLVGWTREEYFFLINSINVMSATYQLFSLIGHEELAFNIVEAKLDYDFVRPVNSYLYNAFWRVHLPSLIQISVCGIFMVYFAPKGLTLLDCFVVIILLFNGALFLFFMQQIANSTAFWLNKSMSVVMIPNLFIQIGEKPKAFYPKTVRFIFSYVLPTLTVLNIVTDYVRGEATVLDFLVLLITLIVLGLLSVFMWKKGIRRYQSGN